METRNQNTMIYSHVLLDSCWSRQIRRLATYQKRRQPIACPFHYMRNSYKKKTFVAAKRNLNKFSIASMEIPFHKLLDELWFDLSLINWLAIKGLRRFIENDFTMLKENNIFDEISTVFVENFWSQHLAIKPLMELF